MKRNNLNVPAILIKKVNGTEKQLSGKLVRINESHKTCSMVFNGKLYKDIPMKHVLINEGFLDKVKEYSKKVYNFIKKTVKGFFVLVDEVTGNFITWSTLTMANTAKQAATGNLPAGILFAPSATLARAAGVTGMDIDNAMAESMNNDRIMIEKYWRRVIRRAGTTDETIEESIKYVNENYYTINHKYKAIHENVVYSLGDIKSDAGYGGYGENIDSEDLIDKLTTNILDLIDGEPGEHSSTQPYLIWGAPGIGKTAIINSVIKSIASNKYEGINLSMITIMLAGYTIENWTLPSVVQDHVKIETSRFTDCPKTWLPVYLRTADPEEAAKRDHYCNTGEYMGNSYSADGRIYEGGVIFMDEFARTTWNVHNIIMGLVNEHKFGDNYVVASKWGFVFASNRSFDDGYDDLDDTRYFPNAAQINRYKHVTYVPTKENWLKWATKIDPITHKANVPPFITEFIANSPEHVWYSTVQNDGYDDILNAEYDGDKKQIDSAKNGTLNSYNAISDLESLKMTKRMVTPRTWANFIGPEYEKLLIRLFKFNKEGLSGKEMYQQLIDKSVESKTDEDGVSYKEYYGGILPNILIKALNEIDDDYWDYQYKLMGGDKKLDPSHTLNGRTARYQKFMAWVREMIASNINDGERKSPLLKKYDDYNSYTKYMTDDVIESIWETGMVPPQYQDDDDYLPNNGIAGYNNTEFAKWKALSIYQKEVLFDKILPAYPGNIYEDMAEDVETLKNAPDLSKQESEQIMEDLQNKTSFVINKDGKKIKKSFFFNPGKDLKKLSDALAYAKTFKYSKVCQKLMNVIVWAAKVAYQVDGLRIVYDIYKYLSEDIFKESPDPEIKDAFLKTKEINNLKASLGKDWQTDPKYRKLTASVPIAPILHMLSQYRNMMKNDLASHKKK